MRNLYYNKSPEIVNLDLKYFGGNLGLCFFNQTSLRA